ncbi:MAG: hypothetical protein K5863_22650 [Nitratireductor sp.]|uniref:hypothetical protein n=1 Tax=Nitratireductor sp. TaxID=1872084 RepID=UPI002612621F|nr:hypothetical protein [Nitratireductor sp.]MCV0352885.1 hypothetical protein [Nitratireductor sp.]
MTRYDDTTGLGRGQAELNVASAQCEIYARQIANKQVGNAAVASLALGGNYLAGAQLGASLGMQRNYNLCLRAQGWVPRAKK